MFLLSFGSFMKKTLAELIDELTVTNIKIFYLIDRVQKNEHTKEESFKAQELNKYRSELKNSINWFFKERGEVKV